MNRKRVLASQDKCELNNLRASTFEMQRKQIRYYSRSTPSLSSQFAFTPTSSFLWESLNAQKYLSFYSQDFMGGGIGYFAFKKHKERVNSAKKQIRVQIKGLAILLPPEYEGKVAVARFDQHYTSSNFRDD